MIGITEKIREVYGQYKANEKTIRDLLKKQSNYGKKCYCRDEEIVVLRGEDRDDLWDEYINENYCALCGGVPEV
jgi:hypothetical protein